MWYAVIIVVVFEVFFLARETYKLITNFELISFSKSLEFRGLKNTEGMAAVAVDLSKAFVSVCHSLLLAKLKAYGLSDEAITLMCSYLHGRKH